MLSCEAYLRFAVLVIGCFCLGPPSVATAQGNDAVSLTISFPHGKTQYHVGEVFHVNLSFVASVGNTYEMSTRTYDRSGRLDLEQFHVSPSGRDPLYNYYHGGLTTGFFMGGLGSQNPDWRHPPPRRANPSELS